MLTGAASIWPMLAVAGTMMLMLAGLAHAALAAYFELGPVHLRDLQERGGRRGERVLTLLARPRRLKATLQATALTATMGVAMVGLPLLDQALPLVEWRSGWRLGLHFTLLVFILLVVGRMMPRAHATAHPVAVALRTSGVVSVLRSCWWPVSELLVRGAETVEKNYTRRSEQQVDVSTLEQALDLTTDAGTTAEEQRILRGIIKFGTIEVRQVMRPRTEMVAFGSDLGFPELLAAIDESGFSRVPVFEGTADRIIGVLHIKDVLPHLDNSTTDWRQLLREPWFVPEHKKLDGLLKEFQARRQHLAVVVDEYGGTSGIITLEDVIEEIVGDITDEYDDEELLYSRLDERTWVFEGRTSLTDLYRVMGIDGEAIEGNKGDSGTLGGFVLELTGRIPAKGELITFRNFRFTIESADNKRIRRIKVHLSDGPNA